MRKRIPINTDGEVAKTVLAGYYKYGCATILGGTFGTTGTAIMDVEYGEDNSDTGVDGGE